MKINLLTMKNFRPFYEEHCLNLSSSGQNNLTLIFAENMRGKTTILNAIRWVLYGHAKNRLGEDVHIFTSDGGDYLLNSVAVRNGIYEMEVKLEFEHQGHEYHLIRSVEATGNPESDDDFIHHKHLRVDNNAVAHEQVDPIISGILHEEISRFSLFDGEMLGEYEKLLTDREKEIETVKDAIEKTLGLPALTHSSTYLEKIKSDYNKEFNKQLLKLKRNEKKIENVNAIEDGLDSAQKDLGEMKDSLSKYFQEKTDAENELHKHNEISKMYERINEIDSEIMLADNKIKDSKLIIQETLQNSWWVPLRSKLKKKGDNFQQQLESEVEAKNVDLICKLLHQSIKEKQCVLCGTGAGKSVGTRIKKRLNKYKAEGKPTQDDRYESRLIEKLDFLSKLETERTEEQLINAATNIIDSESYRADKLARIKSMKEDLGPVNKGDHQSKIKRFDEAVHYIKELERRIDNKQNKIKEMKIERDRIQKELDKAPGADRETQESAYLARVIHNSFNRAIDTFRDRARNVVSEAADKIFRELTTEKDYRGLKINENYGLTILDSQGNDVSGRSAGAEQIVALSLIGGLNLSAAAGDSPVVMDSNFGRLDPEHRENVLKWVSNLKQQVILLVHSGELDKDDISSYGIEYARSYRITRINEWQSNIEQIDG